MWVPLFNEPWQLPKGQRSKIDKDKQKILQSMKNALIGAMPGGKCAGAVAGATLKATDPDGQVMLSLVKACNGGGESSGSGGGGGGGSH
jgi:hypothetical protein